MLMLTCSGSGLGFATGFPVMVASRGELVDGPILRPMDELSDDELVGQYFLAPASDRARRSIDELMRRHHARVVAWCYRMVGSRDLAADLAQDVFVKAYSSLATFRRDSKFTTWLYVITRNRCRDAQRARAVREREGSEQTVPDALYDRNQALAALDARDARTVVRALMDEVLEDTERLVMTLHYGHDMPLDAITAALGLTNASGAKQYIVSAKRKLNIAVKRWTLKS
jgi:RNA polymerase sigma factor (sigma-70 family)